MTKKDLMTGDIIVTRSGYLGVILKDEDKVLYQTIGYDMLSDFNDDLTFDDEAFGAIAHLSIERETGARGLRSILEGLMMKPMYELPSDESVESVRITRGYVEGKEELSVTRK